MLHLVIVSINCLFWGFAWMVVDLQALAFSFPLAQVPAKGAVSSCDGLMVAFHGLRGCDAIMSGIHGDDGIIQG